MERLIFSCVLSELKVVLGKPVQISHSPWVCQVALELLLAKRREGLERSGNFFSNRLDLSFAFIYSAQVWVGESSSASRVRRECVNSFRKLCLHLGKYQHNKI